MHVLNVNSSLDFKTGGGTAERTFQMSRFLAISGIQCSVLTIDTGLDTTRINALNPAKVIALPLFIRRFYIPIFHWKHIKSLVENADIVHLMGHWSVLNTIAYLAARTTNKPYVVCPAGALPLFGRSIWLKRIYNFFIGKRIINNASAWIAITSAELPHFAQYGIPAERVIVIPNGVSKEDFPLADVKAFRATRKLPSNPIILFMGRLNLIKGPDLLLRAFAHAHKQLSDYHLVFAGPDEGMQSELTNIAAQEKISERVHFLGFVNGHEKAAAYQMANLLVVPSRQEAMSIVALEAGICGIPVMLTDQCGFGEIKTISPELEVTADITGIANGLVKLLNNTKTLELAAVSFQKLVLEKYTWGSIVHNYLGLYEKIISIQLKTNRLQQK